MRDSVQESFSPVITFTRGRFQRLESPRARSHSCKQQIVCNLRVAQAWCNAQMLCKSLAAIILNLLDKILCLLYNIVCSAFTVIKCGFDTKCTGTLQYIILKSKNNNFLVDAGTGLLQCADTAGMSG